MPCCALSEHGRKDPAPLRERHDYPQSVTARYLQPGLLHPERKFPPNPRKHFSWNHDPHLEHLTGVPRSCRPQIGRLHSGDAQRRSFCLENRHHPIVMTTSRKDRKPSTRAAKRPPLTKASTGFSEPVDSHETPRMAVRTSQNELRKRSSSLGPATVLLRSFTPPSLEESRIPA